MKQVRSGIVIAFSAFALVAVTGCTGGIAAGALGAGALIPSLAAAAGIGATVISDVAKAACATQAAANVGAEIAAARGQAAWAERFATASQFAGVGCAW